MDNMTWKEPEKIHGEVVDVYNKYRDMFAGTRDVF